MNSTTKKLSILKLGVLLILALFLTPNNALSFGGDGSIFDDYAQGTICDNILPFCTDEFFSFPNANNQTVAPNGGNYGCVYEAPNPVWYYMEIDASGPMQLTISQTDTNGNPLDVDFTMWGPFTSYSAGCTAVTNGAAPIQSSWTTAPTEIVGIGMPGGSNFSNGYGCTGPGASTPPAAIQGQVYIIMITNYSESNGFITFSQTGGTGTADCTIVDPCDITAFTATPSSCSNGKYSVSGTIQVSGGTQNGNLIVTDCNGNTVTVATSPVADGTYSYTLPNLTANGTPCSITASFTNGYCESNSIIYSAPSVPTATATADKNTICAGESINLHATGGGTYSWTGPGITTSNQNSQNPVITNASTSDSGTYTVTVSDGGCSASQSVTITVNPKVTPTFTQIAAFCEGSPTPSLPTTSSNGITGTWNPSIINNTTSGTYTFTPSGSQCASTATMTITVHKKPVVTASAQNPTSCGGNGSIILTFTNVPNGVYTVNYNGGTFTNVTVTNGTATVTAPAGSYNNITINNGNCGSANGVSVTLSDPNPPSTPSITTTSATCSAGGISTISGYNSATNYTFTPAGPTVGTGGVISGATPGTSYSVTATVSGCTSGGTNFTNGAQLPTPTAPTVSTTAATCSAGGASTITNYNSSNTYTFTPSGPTVGANGIINGAAPGTAYAVTTTNGDGCVSSSDNFFNPVQLATPAIALTSADPTACGGNGSIYLTFTDVPDGVYTINYNGGTFTNVTVTNGTATVTAPAGSYNNITINNGDCTSASGVSVSLTDPNPPSTPSINTTQASCSSAGVSTITGYNSSANYVFTPAGPTVGTGGVISGATPGTSYTVTVTVSGCTSGGANFTNSAQLPTPNAPTVTTSTSTCSVAGTSTISNYSGSNTYTFSPSGPSVDASGVISGATAGTTYAVTATNGDGCVSSSDNFNNPIQLATPTVVASGNDPTECAGEGTIFLTFTDVPDGVYTVNYNGGTFTNVTVTNGTATVMAPAGNYNNMTINNGDCTSASGVSVTLTDPNAPATPSINTTQATCSADGVSTLSGYNANATYTFSPSGPTVGTGGLISGATPGTSYSVTATLNGCTSGGANFTNGEQLPSPNAPTISPVAATCTADGTSIITNYNSNNTYEFTPSGPTVGASGAITGANPGISYTVTSTNGDGCTSDMETFENVAQLPTPTVSGVGVNPTVCGGEGSIVLTFTDVPDGVYTVNYNGGTFTNVTVTNGTATVTAPSGGYNNLTINNGDCTSATGVDVSLSDPNAPATPTVSIVAPTCETTGSGSISGYNSTYTYTFSPAGPTIDSQGNIEGATAGTSYTVSVSQNDCVSGGASFVINAQLPTPSTPIVTSTDATCSAAGTSTITNYNSNNTYTFISSGPTLSSGGVISGANPGQTYEVIVSNADGCEAESVTFINEDQLDSPDLDITAENENICEGSSTTITVSGADSYAWDNDLGNGTTHEISPTNTTTYEVVGTNDNGCVATSSITINVHTAPTIDAGEDMTICSGSSADISATGGVSYDWDNGLGEGESHSVSPSEETTYIVTGADEFGCRNTDEVTVFVNPLPELSANETYEICLGEEVTLTVNDANDVDSYAWYLGEDMLGTGSSYTIELTHTSDAGVYTVVAENENGCQAYLDIELILDICDIDITEAISPNGDGKNDNFVIGNLAAYPNTQIWIYNRWGAEVFQSDDYQNDWDGTSQSNLNIGGNELPEGTYYYIFILGGEEGILNAGETYKGYVYIKR